MQRPRARSAGAALAFGGGEALALVASALLVAFMTPPAGIALRIATAPVGAEREPT